MKSEKIQEQINNLLSDTSLLISKKPFTRGTVDSYFHGRNDAPVSVGQCVEAKLPRLKQIPISQDTFKKELDPYSHAVLFDDNVPSITMKLKDGSYQDIKFNKMAVPFQRLIKDKHVLRLCGNPMNFTLMDTEPTEKQNKDFAIFKQFWNLRNMDGMRTKMVDAQKSIGDAGLLFYFDYKGQIKARLLSYLDGYVLCPHNDENGDRILESVYYQVDGDNYIDSYDDTYMYRHVQRFSEDSVRSGEWELLPPVKHGFSEIPLVTKRGKVAWDNVQNIIESYEIMYNIFLVIQKRHGWGILYVKGKFKDEGKRIAGAIVLNDTSMDGNGSADFKQAPTPDGMLKTLELMEETIQKGSGCTFILPKDISLSGDISGVAVKISQELDNETSLLGAIEWQNVADKMCRLFKEGLAKELVQKGINQTAVTDFENLHINAKFKEWMPQSDTDYNSMLIQLKGAGLISEETGIERNTESSPDEKLRRQKEKDEELALKEKELSLQYGGNDNNSDNNQNTGNLVAQNNNNNNGNQLTNQKEE